MSRPVSQSSSRSERWLRPANFAPGRLSPAIRSPSPQTSLAEARSYLAATTTTDYPSPIPTAGLPLYSQSRVPYTASSSSLYSESEYPAAVTPVYQAGRYRPARPAPRAYRPTPQMTLTSSPPFLDDYAFDVVDAMELNDEMSRGTRPATRYPDEEESIGGPAALQWRGQPPLPASIPGRRTYRNPMRKLTRSQPPNNNNGGPPLRFCDVCCNVLCGGDDSGSVNLSDLGCFKSSSGSKQACAPLNRLTGVLRLMLQGRFGPCCEATGILICVAIIVLPLGALGGLIYYLVQVFKPKPLGT